MSYQDRTLTCADCGQPFVDPARDQQFRADRGFTNDPKRCPDCRAARRNDSGGYSSGGGGGYSGGGYGGGGGGGYGRQREMFDVVCASCGKQTQVPFQPRGDRPVYCSDCFQSQGSSSRGGGGGSRGGGSRGGGGYGRGGRY